MLYKLEFEVPRDWNPMRDPICWAKCPVAPCIRLGQSCFARELYEKDGTIVCPIVKYTVKEQLSKHEAKLKDSVSSSRNVRVETILGSGTIIGPYYPGAGAYRVRMDHWSDETIKNMGGESRAYIILGNNQILSVINEEEE